jgi:16S rRNA (cytidine1402-2'-O)-methyltransferase
MPSTSRSVAPKKNRGLSGVLYIVATPIGNLEDITLRALRILREADVVAAEDTRAAQVLLLRHGIERKVVSCFEGNEAARAEQLVAQAASGARIALISEAGTPGISDPGERLVARAVAAGVRIEPIPGPSAAMAALVASGLPTERFLFVGFPPRTEGERQQMFARMRTLDATLVFYEAPPRVGRTLADLAAALSPSRRAVLVRELTKVHEEFIRGTVGELAARYAGEAPRGEVTLVIEGAPPGTMEESVDIEAAIRAALAAGRTAKEIAAELALRTGKPRRAIYQLAIALKKE